MFRQIRIYCNGSGDPAAYALATANPSHADQGLGARDAASKTFG